MAREPEKSARETSKTKSETTAGSKDTANGEAGRVENRSGGSADLLKAQHQELQSILAKRSEATRTRVRS